MKKSLLGLFVAVGVLASQASFADLVTNAPVNAQGKQVLDFGSQYQGTLTNQTLIISNNGTELVNNIVIDISGNNNPNYYIVGNDCPASLFPGQGCNVVIQFAPTRNGQFNKNLSIDGDSASGSLSTSVRLQGATIK